MDFVKVTWKDHVKQYPNRYYIESNDSNTVDLTPVPGVITSGTPINPANMNRLENGVEYLYHNLFSTGQDLTTQNLNIIGLKLELQTIMNAKINSIDANIVAENFIDLEDVLLIDGKYDPEGQYIYL